MRAVDVQISTPVKPVLYAIGSSPQANPAVWNDPDSWYSHNYVPGYVLGEQRGGFLVLSADHYPDSKRAKQREQADAEEARGYTLEDYQKRLEVLKVRPYTYGPKYAAQQEAWEKKLAALKPLPNWWQVRAVLSRQIQMLWPEYAVRLEASVREIQAANDREKRERNRLKTAKRRVLEDLVILDIGQSAEDLDYLAGGNSEEIRLDHKVVRKLIDGYTRPVSETEKEDI